MDQTTHNVHHANWLALISRRQKRAEGISVSQCLSDNGVKEKVYYYWLQKFCKEAYEQMHFSVTNENQSTEIAFTEITIPAKTVPSYIPSPAEPSESPVAVIRYNGHRDFQ